MKTTYWAAIVVAALIVGALLGYGMWGSQAARLPGVESELTAAQGQLDQTKKKLADIEANLGKVTNEKLNLEKENADLKEALEKATKKRR
jgi:peptidoglycan hydrolase CwlO-like protein